MTQPSAGEIWKDRHSKVRVMAVVDGWVMLRRFQAVVHAPIVCQVTTFIDLFKKDEHESAIAA